MPRITARRCLLRPALIAVLCGLSSAAPADGAAITSARADSTLGILRGYSESALPSV